MSRGGRSFGALALALVAAVAVVAASGAACSRKKDKEARSTASTASTAPTTTTVDTGPTTPAPLTGLPMPEAEAGRGLLIVKVDNDPSGRPQHGLAEADVVYEQMVEGGVTRFAALYHSTDAAVVGPVRSARSTDMNLATSFNRPLFAYSGANSVFKVLVRKAVFVDVGLDAVPKAYTRRDDYKPPSNVFTSTSALYERTPFPGSTPPALWPFRSEGAPQAEGRTAGPASEVSVVFPGRAATKVQWTWDPGAKAWMRAEAGEAHLDAAGKQLSATNVIVHFAEYKDSGIRDRSSAPVPEAQLVGEGEAWMLVDGTVVKGRWVKPSLTKPTEYLDEQGRAVSLAPGRTWVELAPPGSGAVR